jgi:hypothetical protein
MGRTKHQRHGRRHDECRQQQSGQIPGVSRRQFAMNSRRTKLMPVETMSRNTAIAGRYFTQKHHLKSARSSDEITVESAMPSGTMLIDFIGFYKTCCWQEPKHNWVFM